MNVFSLRTRLALFHLGAIVVILTATAFAAHWGLTRAVHEQLDAALLALAEAEMAMIPADPRQPIRVHEVRPGPAPPSFARLDRLVQIVDADGHVLARSANLGAARLPTPHALQARLGVRETAFETLLEFAEEPTRLVSVPVEVGGVRYVVQVAGSLDDVNRVLNSARVLFIAMSLALLAAVGVAGALLTRRAFRPIDDVVQQARRIGEASLAERLPHPGARDEIGRLVDTLNDMLKRLERSFEVQRRFTADASHELRSPLSRLRAELEVTLRRPRERTEYEETLRSCLEEVERLSILTEELLHLARLDAGEGGDATEEVALVPIAEDAVRGIEPAARERQVGIALEPSAPVAARVAPGPASLVLKNLLDNAVKFSPPGGRVTVRVTADDGDAVVTVSDVGRESIATS